MRKAVGRCWKIAAETVKTAYAHQCPDAAAAMAFDFVFAIFPGILGLTALLGLTNITPSEFKAALDCLGIVIPGPLLVMVQGNIEHLWESSQSLFFVGILGVFWPASASMSTTIHALNRAYGAVDQRSFWRSRILSIVLIFSFGLALIILFNLIVFGRQLELWIRVHWAFRGPLSPIVGSMPRMAVGVGTFGVVASIYRIIPAPRQRWVDVLPGSLLFLCLWGMIMAGFGYYVRHFGYYNVVYGVLGAVIVTLLAAYLVALILLLGGELNATIYRLKHERLEKSSGHCSSSS